jgi:hypothetical protein
LFDDGSREWPELGIAAKLRVFCPPLLAGIWGGFALAGIISYFVFPRDEHSLFVAIFPCLVGVIPVLLCSPYHVILMLRSKQRFEGARRVGLGDV